MVTYIFRGEVRSLFMCIDTTYYVSQTLELENFSE
jgi:hypothetical protein